MTPPLDLKQPKTLLIISIALVGLVFAPFASLVTVAASIVLFAGVALFGLGVFSRLAVATLFYGVFGAIALQASSVLHAQLPFVLLHMVLLAAAFCYALYFKDKIDLRTSITDAAGMLVGLATFLFIAMPLFGASTSKTLDYLIAGEDNNSHFQMYRYVVEEGKYGYHNHPSEAGMRPTLLSYAQGSHGAMAAVTAPIAQNATPADQLKIYAFSAAATFALTFWLAFLLVAKPLSALKDWRLQGPLTALLAFLYTVAVPLGIFLSLYTYGYYPQYFSYLGCAFVLLAVLSATVKPKDSKTLVVEVGALLLGFYAVFSSWYLIAPIAAIVLLGYGWVNREEVLRNKVWILALLVPMVLICAHLAYVFVLKSSGVGHLLTPGGVEKMDWWVLLAGVPAAVIAFIAGRKRQWHLLGFSLSFLAAVGIAAAIGLYQKKKLGHFDYYFYKTLFTALYVAVLYYGYLSAKWLAEALAYSKPAHLRSTYILLPTLGVLVICLVATVFNPPKYLNAFTTVKYALPQEAPNRVLDVFTDDSIYSKYSDAIVLSSCNPYTNFTGTIWAAGFFLPYNTERQKIENELLSRGTELAMSGSSFLAEIEAYAAQKTKPVAVIYGDLCQTENGIQQIKTLKNIEVMAPAAQ